MADALLAADKSLEGALSGLRHDLEGALKAALHPRDGEQANELFARGMRTIWLQAAAAETGETYRSPTDEDIAGIEHRPRGIVFGYERDLQPTALEERCGAFFPQPPSGWRAAHLMFSSGQAAMSAALIAASEKHAPLSVANCSAYFETKTLLETLPHTKSAASGDAADLLIVEPVSCNGAFIELDVAALLKNPPPLVLFDSTLLGRTDSLNNYLGLLADAPSTIMRLCSGLKLMQGGLELANVGILSIYAKTPDEMTALVDRLHGVRTLMGLGLHYADLLALQARWFLDPAYTERYQDAVFEHNARLALRVAENNYLFEPVSHPALDGRHAPYCVFRLRDEAGYDDLEARIDSGAKERLLNLDHGGSFGFRGHRFEVVRPETGETPFLRVALGRRAGWSLDGTIDLIGSLAARDRV